MRTAGNAFSAHSKNVGAKLMNGETITGLFVCLFVPCAHGWVRCRGGVRAYALLRAVAAAAGFPILTNTSLNVRADHPPHLRRDWLRCPFALSGLGSQLPHAAL